MRVYNQVSLVEVMKLLRMRLPLVFRKRRTCQKRASILFRGQSCPEWFGKDSMTSTEPLLWSTCSLGSCPLTAMLWRKFIPKSKSHLSRALRTTLFIHRATSHVETSYRCWVRTGFRKITLGTQKHCFPPPLRLPTPRDVEFFFFKKRLQNINGTLHLAFQILQIHPSDIPRVFTC